MSDTYPCPDCGYEGPHTWFALNEAECGSCYAEFTRGDEWPDRGVAEAGP